MAEVKLRIKQIDEGSRGISTFGKNLNNLLDTAQKTGAAVAGAAVTFKKAFDLSREGANINQLTQSFELMNAQVFRTPDLLDQMSEAARGTIKETDLMAGLLKLTAGASDEMAQRFAQAAPRLLEIAKASNKLNPELGDTAFLYDSIATGIKRSSPLILDNLGIVIKVGEANEKYAEALGKNVEALSAEEKQIALLNAVLESGDSLINQVGGSVDAQADAWARLEVQVLEATDAFKQFMANGLLPVIQSAAGDYGKAVEEIIDKNIEQAASVDELIAAALRLKRTEGDIGNVGKAVTGTSDEFRQGARDIAFAIAAVSNGSQDLRKNLEAAFGDDLFRNVDEMGLSFVDLGSGVSIWVDELEYAADHTNRFSQDLERLSTGARDAAQAQKEWAAATEAAAADTVLLRGATHSADNAATDYNMTLEELAQLGRSKLPEAVKNVNEILAEQELAAARAEEEMRALNERMGTYFDSALNATGPAESLASIMYDAGMNAGLNAEQMAILAGATGEFTEAQIEAALKTAFMTEQINLMVQAIGPDFTVDDAVGALQLLEDGLADSAEEAMNLWMEMNKIPAEVNSRVIVTYKTDKSEWLPPPDAPPSNWGGPSGGGQSDSDYVGGDGRRAAGGPVWGGGMYQVGEFNRPELLEQNGRLFLIPGDQGSVIPSSQMGGAMGGVTVSAPINVVIQGEQDSGQSAWVIQKAVNQGIRDALTAVGLM